MSLNNMLTFYVISTTYQHQSIDLSNKCIFHGFVRRLLFKKGDEQCQKDIQIHKQKKKKTITTRYQKRKINRKKPYAKHNIAIENYGLTKTNPFIIYQCILQMTGLFVFLHAYVCAIQCYFYLYPCRYLSLLLWGKDFKKDVFLTNKKYRNKCYLNKSISHDKKV